MDIPRSSLKSCLKQPGYKSGEKKKNVTFSQDCKPEKREDYTDQYKAFLGQQRRARMKLEGQERSEHQCECLCLVGVVGLTALLTTVFL